MESLRSPVADVVGAPISRRSARHEQISSVQKIILGDHSHRRRHSLRGCMARRGRLLFLRQISFRISRGSPPSPTQNWDNPWGMSHTATSPFWISNQGTNTATLYAVTNTLERGPAATDGNITIPPPQAHRRTAPPAKSPIRTPHPSQFRLRAAVMARRPLHLCHSERHHRRLERRPNRVFTVPTQGVVYTGLAINRLDPIVRRQQAGGRIDVFNGSFTKVNNGAFATPGAIQQANSSRSTCRPSATGMWL